MNHIERVLCAIDHKKPDKVPKGEWFIDQQLLQKMLGKVSIDGITDYIHLWNLLGMDLKATKGGYEIKENLGCDESGRKIFSDVWGCTYKESNVGFLTPNLIQSPIDNINEVYNYKFPSLDDFDVNEIKQWVDNSDFFIFSIVHGAFEFLTHLVGGFEEYMVYLMTNPKDLSYLINQFTQFQAELAKKYIRAGAHGIIISDDLAYNSGPFFSPDLFRQWLKPSLREEIKSIKEFADVPIFFHSDGNINPILDDIVDLGIDGIHPLEKHAGMDIFSVKKRYGSKICLMGNVDTNHTLPFGTPEDVEKEVYELIENLSFDGGFILRASNLLTSDIPVVNVLAMYYAAEKYGAQ